MSLTSSADTLRLCELGGRPRGGARRFQDYRLYKRRRVLEILLTFYSSPLADDVARRLVLEVTTSHAQGRS